MATKKVNPKVIRVAPAINPSAAPVDDETQEELGDKIVAIRDTYAYANVPLSQHMESAWGAFTAIRTGTDKEESEVWLYRAEPGEKGSVPVTRPGTGNSLGFSVALPLKKLNLRPAADRQWNLVPIEQPINGTFPAFILAIKERHSVPRDVSSEETEAARAQVSQAVAQKAAKLKAGLAKAAEPEVDEDEEMEE